jgi:hypothetical protein
MTISLIVIARSALFAGRGNLPIPSPSHHGLSLPSRQGTFQGQDIHNVLDEDCFVGQRSPSIAYKERSRCFVANNALCSQ